MAVVDGIVDLIELIKLDGIVEVVWDSIVVAVVVGIVLVIVDKILVGIVVIIVEGFIIIEDFEANVIFIIWAGFKLSGNK